jgi:alkaline phosphatase D
MIVLFLLRLVLGDKTKIAIGSCYGQFFYKNPEILYSISAWEPDLFIWLGDVAYVDFISFPQPIEIQHRKQWENLLKDFKSTPEYVNLKNSTKITGIWDDHDLGINDADSSFFMKMVSQDIFMDFIEDKVDHEGIYRVYELDPRIKIIMLDVRYFRTKEIDILGETQWKWLEKELEDHRKITFIVTGIQVNVEDRFSLTEQWDEPSRLKLISLIKDKPGIVLVTGDIHFGEILRNDCQNYPIIEITASGLTHTEATIYGSLANWYLHMCNAMTYSESTRVLIKHFGGIEIDWDKDIISFSLMDTYGNVITSYSAYIQELYHKVHNGCPCFQSPLERHLKHIGSCFVVFHFPLILITAVIIIYLRKWSHSSKNH